jgi:hypothetical protein
MGWRGALTVLIVPFLLTGSAFGQDYPSTQAGLQKLVADDVTMLPAPDASRLRKKLTDWENGIGVKCYHFPNVAPFCTPAVKDVIVDIQSHISKIDGLVIDSDEWSDQIPASEVPADGGGVMQGGLPVTLSQVLPRAVLPISPASASFNEAVMDFGRELWKRLGGPPRSNPGIDSFEDVDIDYALDSDSLPGVISVVFPWNYDEHGAAHGEFGFNDFNWNVAQNRPVEISDIFDTKTDWRHGLADAMMQAFQNENEAFFGNYTEDQMAQAVSDPTQWGLTKRGLRMDTQTYEAGGYAAGAPAAIVDWAELKPYLKKGGLVTP